MRANSRATRAAAQRLIAVRKQLARLRQSEATSRAVFKSISDGILLLGRDGRVVDANPAAVRMLGVRDRKALVGMDAETFSRRFHVSGTNGRLIAPDRYVSQRALLGETPSPYKVVIFPESGAPKTISSSAAPVRFHPDGPVLLSVSVMRDITESEALERLRLTVGAHDLDLARATAAVGREAAGRRPDETLTAYVERLTGVNGATRWDALVVAAHVAATHYPGECALPDTDSEEWLR